MADNQELVQFANAELVVANNALANLNNALANLGIAAVTLSQTTAQIQASIGAVTFTDPGD